MSEIYVSTVLLLSCMISLAGWIWALIKNRNQHAECALAVEQFRELRRFALDEITHGSWECLRCDPPISEGEDKTVRRVMHRITFGRNKNKLFFRVRVMANQPCPVKPGDHVHFKTFGDMVTGQLIGDWEERTFNRELIPQFV